ncbi:MAG TPA: hypothetical protein VHO46_06245 [Bacteroidales bacterium]|nr:hypothetical protein [Bacteroidales bacterium]
MKNVLLTLSFFLLTGFIALGQDSDQQVVKCLATEGSDTKYLKDFRVQLGKADDNGELRYKANISLWGGMTYRFTMCNMEGALILSVKNDASQVVISSFDSKSGKTYTSVDFQCKKSGIYQLNYDFSNDKQGSGVGIVSVLK